MQNRIIGDFKLLLTKNNSSVLKGLGIILMLIHHLFYVRNGMYDDLHLFGNNYLVHQIGIFGKLCVSLFVFLSGYGLTASYKDKEVNAFEFYKSRFKKLYFNYWFIWLIFVPIGVFVFHRSFGDVYGPHALLKAGLEFLGIYNLFGGLGYNPTWWFYSCIIVLYLLFPFLRRLYFRWPYLTISVMLALPVAGSLPVARACAYYLLPFAVGMWMATVSRQTFERISVTQLVITMLALALVRNFSDSLVFIIDTLLCVGLALFVAKVKFPVWLNKAFVSLGTHSMNIFLFHTFIYYYWFQDLIYSSRNPLVIFLFLIAVCWIISVVLEFIKRRIGFYKLCTNSLVKAAGIE